MSVVVTNRSSSSTATEGAAGFAACADMRSIAMRSLRYMRSLLSSDAGSALRSA